MSAGLIRGQIPIEDLDNEFIVQIKDKLGYNLPAETNTVNEIFNQLGINPFTIESVQAYQTSEENRQNRLKRMPVIHALEVAAISLFIFLVNLVCIGTIIELNEILYKSVLVLSVFFLLFSLLIAITRNERLSKFYWYQTSLTNYSEPIPEFVLQTALKINEAIQNQPNQVTIQFLVEHLHDLSDSFLIARIADLDYYLEVWSEPDYKQIRKV